MLTIKVLPVPGYENVIEATDPAAKLKCFIAIHNCSLGPALGGVRMYPYRSRDEALKDVLLLAESMTYKSAAAEIGLGGGKSVIIGNPLTDKTDQLLHAFGEVVDTLQGVYIAAEDVGTSPEDLVIIKERTPYVVALPMDTSSGDPSRFTARGVFRGMQAVAQKLWHSPSLHGKRVAIQGLGHVGSRLASLLFWEGAELILTEIDRDLLKHFGIHYGAETVSPKDIYSVECDIFAPCAMGGSINDSILSKLRCKAIAGSANNQLSDQVLGARLMQMGILYAPDYIINAGGIINAAAELEVGGYDPKKARDKTDRIYDQLLEVFKKADREHKATNRVADEIAKYNLEHGIGKREGKLRFE